MNVLAASGELMARRVGEVVESNSASFLAQCYQVEGAPVLGALVRTQSPDIYGVVSSITTEPLDSARPVLARGENAASEEEVLRLYPQLNRLLTSRFRVLIAGYDTRRDTGHDTESEIRQSLPPLPPRVHSFVYVCSPAEIERFTARLDLLRLLLESRESHADEVVSACLRHASTAGDDAHGFLRRAAQSLALELANDVTRLNAILRRVAP